MQIRLRLGLGSMLVCLLHISGCAGRQHESALASPPPSDSRSSIQVVPVSATLVGQHVRQFELTRDGNLFADGRFVAAIAGSEVRDARGTLLFWLRADGAFIDRFGASPVHFRGDDLVEGHNRLLVAPGGHILSVLPAGSSEIAGQVVRGARFRRTVLVALFVALAAR
jgi:hypothetical protein